MKRSFIYILGLVVILAVIYFSYDLLKRIISPCDSIFEQTTSQLKTKVELFNTNADIVLGSQKIQEISESAHETALTLKACCKVYGGDSREDKFNDCKNTTNKYEDKIDLLIDLAAEAKKAKTEGNTETYNQNVTKINQSIDEVKSITSKFQSEVNTLTKTAKTETPESRNLDSTESEPNDDLFQPTSIPLDKWIDASIGSESDVDYYLIKTPETYPDLVKIELDNQSTTLKPHIGVYYNNKQWMGGSPDYHGSVTAGQDVEYTFHADPDTFYYIVVTSLDKKPSNYKLKVFTLNAYDQHEPNDEILKAKLIKLNSTVEANFTDKRDVDFYKIDTPGLEKNIKVIFENLTTKIKPHIGVYLDNKQWLGGSPDYHGSVTAGQDTEFVFKADPNSVYYIYIANLAGTDGEYKIKVIEQDIPDPEQ